MKTAIVTLILIFGAQFATAQAPTRMDIAKTLKLIDQEVTNFKHSTTSMIHVHRVIKESYGSVSRGRQSSVNPYLASRPELLNDAVIHFQSAEFYRRGLLKPPPARILNPAYVKLIGALKLLAASRVP